MTPEGIAKMSDEDAYLTLVLTEAQWVTSSHNNEDKHPGDRTMGERVDWRLRNMGAGLYQAADEAKCSVDEASKLFENYLFNQSEKDSEHKAFTLLKLKAWRHRRSEGGL
jgi:hypothetical protein